jgi:myosin heavy subunit
MINPQLNTLTLLAAAEKATSITEQIEELQKRLRSKNKIDWQEEMLLKELIKQRAEMEKSLKDLENQLKDLSDTEEKFKEPSAKLKEQAKQLEKLMNDVLDEETRKMYDELQKLLQENSSSEEVQEQLSKISNQEKNMEQELERAIELFKRLKVETNLEQAAQQLDKLAKKQEELSNQTNKADSLLNQTDEMTSDLAQKQQEIAETYEEIKEKIKDAEQLNQQLKQPEPLENLNDDLQELDKGMNQAQDNLDNSDLKKGADQQKKNSEKLKETSEKLSQMTANMEMEMLTEDIDNLRNIVDNLLKLSFEQERLIDAFYDVKQVDPRFVELSQEQLKLKDDAEIVKDSLLALSERVAQLSTAITREVAEVNRNIDAALTNLRDRNRNKALSNQQFAMASINELALLLDVLLQQMQDAMASSMGKGKPKDGKGNNLPNMKQLQEQISQQIKDLDGTGQKGRKLSEQLAKTAAQQEMLRDKMNELRNALKGQPGGQEAGESLEDAIKLMEQNEQDLVNKRISQQLMNRQQDIMTRMLDAENAMEEQDFDDEREANSAKDTQRNLPKAFEDYLREREKEIELLKTVPIGLNPFYKKEVNSYFRRLSTDN